MQFKSQKCNRLFTWLLLLPGYPTILISAIGIINARDNYNAAKFKLLDYVIDRVTKPVIKKNYVLRKTAMLPAYCSRLTGKSCTVSIFCL